MIRESITQAIGEEIKKLTGVLHVLEGKTKVKGRRKISAAGRKRIAARVF
jgi:hypothetical protein